MINNHKLFEDYLPIETTSKEASRGFCRRIASNTRNLPLIMQDNKVSRELV